MPVEPHVVRTLSIWRDFAPSRALVLSDEKGGHWMLDLESNLQQEVYSWQLREDPFAGVEDEGVRRNLRDRLERLDVSKPPQERRLAVLADFVLAAERAMDSQHVVWSESLSQPPGHEELPNEINALVAFVLHLKWLLGCFANRPSISVSIR